MALSKAGESKDIFIRRVYTYQGISVAVEIDNVAGTVSMVEQKRDGSWKPKQWIFAGREVEYMAGWQRIFNAMEYATDEARKVLAAVKDKGRAQFVELLLHLHDTLDADKDEGF